MKPVCSEISLLSKPDQECFLPDLGALVCDRLLPIEDPQELFALVAHALSERLSGRCRVSADSQSDWGRLWTATADGSIVPEGKNPFPVELVSKRMGFEELDVTLFCDMTHALRQPPIKAQTNESTGLHVHIGRYPGFFSVEEGLASVPNSDFLLKGIIMYYLIKRHVLAYMHG